MPMFRIMGPSVMEEALARHLRELGLVDGPLTRRQLVGFSRMTPDQLRRSSVQQTLDTIRALGTAPEPDFLDGHLTPSSAWAADEEDFDAEPTFDAEVENDPYEFPPYGGD